MNRKERQEARADRYRELARNAEKQSTAAYNRSHEMVACIPMGQPILVGHHSEKVHRSLLDRSWNTMGKSVELREKAEYYNSKAAAAESNNSIYLGDDDAVERLQEKVNDLEKVQAMMKAANRIIRNKKLSVDAKTEQLHELGFAGDKAAILLKPDAYGEMGFPSYKLTNNNARTRDAKQRLERAKALKNATSKEYEINGVRVVENTEENRLQLFFDCIPSKDIRSELSHNAFRWSRFNNCWQSYLNRWQIDRAKSILDKLS